MQVFIFQKKLPRPYYFYLKIYTEKLDLLFSFICTRMSTLWKVVVITGKQKVFDGYDNAITHNP